MEQVTAWKCSGCGKTSLYKSNTRRHEKTCWKRKENKACGTCKHFYIERDSHYAGHRFGEAHYDGYDTYYICDIEHVQTLEKYVDNCTGHEYDEKWLERYPNYYENWLPRHYTK